ncbi:hypothetical protein PCANC_18195 [Puccinia coronata f. sp. avenae]|uniref:Uncharacterized protein n=1 Tax=Puccinia coronata f. sp. avenae TaxID=200324 RepID=A0A2N5SJW3_9BASI|nr:hypothetical protein PCANC_18195 [Puccinia coronata f. sp. avenae]
MAEQFNQDLINQWANQPLPNHSNQLSCQTSYQNSTQFPSNLLPLGDYNFQLAPLPENHNNRLAPPLEYHGSQPAYHQPGNYDSQLAGYQAVDFSTQLSSQPGYNSQKAANYSAQLDPQPGGFIRPLAPLPLNQSTSQLLPRQSNSIASRAPVHVRGNEPPAKKAAAVVPKKRAAPKVNKHVQLVPKHVLDQACRQKRWETTPSQLPDDSELLDLNLCPQNNQHFIVADSPNVLSPKSNDDASGEDNSSVEGEKSGEDGKFDFEQAENDPPPSLPPPLSSPPVANDDTVSHLESRANGVAIVNIDHSRLQEMFKLDSEEADMARCILEMTLENRDAALVYAALSHPTRETSQFGLLQPPAITTPREEVVVEPQVNLSTFTFGNTFKNNLKNFIRQTLMDCKLETYNLEHDPSTNMVIDCSLVRLTNRWIASLKPPEKANYLPPGFVQKNPQAVQMLLKNVIENSVNRAIRGPIPNLLQLYSHIQKHLPCSNEFVQKEEITTHVWVRFVYLRLETIAYHRSRLSSRAAQWGPIDRQLLLLDEKGLDYSHAWSELILQKDLFFFGSGDATYKQLPTNVALIPTEEEVLEQKNTSRSRRVANAAASFSQV